MASMSSTALPSENGVREWRDISRGKQELKLSETNIEFTLASLDEEKACI